MRTINALKKQHLLQKALFFLLHDRNKKPQKIVDLLKFGINIMGAINLLHGLKGVLS